MDPAQTKNFNKLVLMSGAEYFSDNDAINALYNSKPSADVDKAKIEHQHIRQALESIGITVKQVSPPPDCQDGVYTANWALVKNGKAVMSRLPNKRKPEERFAHEVLNGLGLQTMVLPPEVEYFSGQGDALPCGDTLFIQSPYRTTRSAHEHVKEMLGFREIVSLSTKPARWSGFGPAKKNKLTGLPDSPTYDLDLALAVLKPPTASQKGLIAYCPDVFRRHSRRLLRGYQVAEKIEVSRQEALNAYALNLVSTGENVVMNSGAPVFQAALEARGLKTIALNLPELKKGGGSIRCSTLTLDN